MPRHLADSPADYAHVPPCDDPPRHRAPRFRIHKRKGQLKRARSTPWHLHDRKTGKHWLVSDWRGALELAEAVTR